MLLLNFADGPDALIDALMQAQGRRMDEQRADLFPFPGLQGNEDIINKIQEYICFNFHSFIYLRTAELEGGIDEQLLEMVARAQGQRMNEQRSELGGRKEKVEGLSIFIHFLEVFLNIFK